MFAGPTALRWRLSWIYASTFDLYAGIRPLFLFHPDDSPLKTEKAGAIDLVIVRGSTEGPFSGRKGNRYPVSPNGSRRAKYEVRNTECTKSAARRDYGRGVYQCGRIPHSRVAPEPAMDCRIRSLGKDADRMGYVHPV
jgi:hypothetical protein